MDGPEPDRPSHPGGDWSRASDPRAAEGIHAEEVHAEGIRGTDISGTDISGTDISGEHVSGRESRGGRGRARRGRGEEIGVIRVSVSTDPAGDGGAGRDVIESAPPGLPRRHPATAWAVAAALIAGGVAGYLVGVRHSGSASASPSASPLPVGQPALAGTGARCAIQLGNRLQLGIEVVNGSPTGLTIDTVDTNLPLGGLRQMDSALGSCGELAPARAGGYRLGPGATTWLTATFDVLEPCPAPMPVAFVLGYEQAGRVDDAQVSAFADLGDVPYSGCSATPSG